MLYFTKQVCWLVPKQLTYLSAALEPADKKGLKNLANDHLKVNFFADGNLVRSGEKLPNAKTLKEAIKDLQNFLEMNYDGRVVLVAHNGFSFDGPGSDSMKPFRPKFTVKILGSDNYYIVFLVCFWSPSLPKISCSIEGTATRTDVAFYFMPGA
jgi:hypothetical protein